MKTRLFLSCALAAGLIFHLSQAQAAEDKSNFAERFPFVIQMEAGASGFAAGDKVTIGEVRGDRPHIEPGGSYFVEGKYILESAPRGTLALFCTTHGISGPTPVQTDQEMRIEKGSGKFRLYETNAPEGWLHVSFYTDDSGSHGGIYFGEKGQEKTIMRNAEWFRNVGRSTKSSSQGPNAALMAYLGSPVAPPADLDSRYTAAGLRQAFAELCRRTGLAASRVEVDDSEFPFLVYGTLVGDRPLPEESAFEAPYAYGGSVRGSNGDGSACFAVNIIPARQYPAGQAEACERRLLLRLQMLASRAQQRQ